MTGTEAPLIVATNWGARGGAALAVLFIAIAVVGFFYWRVVGRTNLPSPTRLAFACAVALATAWGAPVLLSSDVYAYAAYGEIARLGSSPYLSSAPLTFDPLVKSADLQWGTTLPICLYGPAFIALAEVTVRLFAPFGMLAQLQALRAVSSLALLACVPLAYAAYDGIRSTRLRAAATIGLNPVAIWCAAEGHNDALALACVLLGFAIVRRRRPSLGAAVIALSALVKAPGIAAAFVLGLRDRRARAGAIIGSAIAVALSIPLFEGIVMHLAPHGRYAPQASLQAIFAPLSPVAAWAAAIVACMLLAARGAALLRLGSDEAWVWLGLAVWFLIPNPYPWYSLWLLALAAIAPRTPGGRVAILLSFTSLLRYVPDAIGPPSRPVSVLLGVLASLPLVALVAWRPWYNKRPA
ncbi:MAG TPA: glycosyltransferase family 87 protein [Candidatus Cybelea sp.]